MPLRNGLRIFWKATNDALSLRHSSATIATSRAPAKRLDWGRDRRSTKSSSDWRSISAIFYRKILSQVCSTERKSFLTQRRKGAKEDAKKSCFKSLRLPLRLCAFAPLREKIFLLSVNPAA